MAFNFIIQAYIMLIYKYIKEGECCAKNKV